MVDDLVDPVEMERGDDIALTKFFVYQNNSARPIPVHFFDNTGERLMSKDQLTFLPCRRHREMYPCNLRPRELLVVGALMAGTVGHRFLASLNSDVPLQACHTGRRTIQVPLEPCDRCRRPSTP